MVPRKIRHPGPRPYSAGSGKTNSTSWLAHHFAALHDAILEVEVLGGLLRAIDGYPGDPLRQVLQRASSLSRPCAIAGAAKTLQSAGV